MKTPLSILLGVVLLAGVLLFLAPSGEEGGAAPSIAAHAAPSSTASRSATSAARSASARAHAADAATPREIATGILPGWTREDRLAAIEADREEAERAYLDRIDENLDRLEASAERARQQGRHAQADVMEQRIEGLLRRLDTFAEQGQDEDG